MESIADARRLLTINTGSSSLKAALYRLREDTTETPELRAEASRIGGRGGSMRLADDRGETLDEEAILEATGLPPAPPLENRKVLNGASSGGTEEFFGG